MNKNWYLAIVWTLIAGCIGIDKNVDKNQKMDLLNQVVNLSWRYKIEENWSAYYRLTTAESQKTITETDFLNKEKLNIVGYTIQNIKLIDDNKALCEIKYTILLTIKHNDIDISAVTEEEWIMEDGNWRLNLVNQLNSSPVPLKMFDKTSGDQEEDHDHQNHDG